MEEEGELVNFGKVMFFVFSLSQLNASSQLWTLLTTFRAATPEELNKVFMFVVIKSLY